MNPYKIILLFLTWALGVQAQAPVVSPAYGVTWASHRNTDGDHWLVLKDNENWGAATSKNYVLPSQNEAVIQYQLDRYNDHMAFGFNYTSNDNNSTQASTYLENIDRGFVLHQHNLYMYEPGKLYLLEENIAEPKLLSISYDRDKDNVLFYIGDDLVGSLSYTEDDTLYLTALLKPGSYFDQPTCNFSFPLGSPVARSHASGMSPASGMIVAAPEGGLPPYQVFCQETGNSSVIQAGLQPGFYHLTVKDSLNDSLLVRIGIGFENTWRIVRNMAITDTAYVKTGSDTTKTGILLSDHVVTEGDDGFCEVTTTETTQGLAFGFFGFDSGQVSGDYTMPLVEEEAIHGLMTYADSLLIENQIDSSAQKVSLAYQRLHMVYFNDGLVTIGFKGYTLTGNGSLTYQPGDVFRMERSGTDMRLYKNDIHLASNTVTDLETQTMLSALMLKNGAALVRNSVSLNLRHGVIATLAPEALCLGVPMNWVRTRTFDENGLVKSDGIAYMDDIGRNIQNQVRQFSTGNTLVSEPLFDSWGRAVGQSLPAPSFQQELCYVDHFIQRYSGTAYAPGDFDNAPGTGLSGDILNAFDALGDVNHPKSVYNGTQGKLGWYYSDNNNAEPLVAADELPYARVEYDDAGRLRRSAGVGTVLSMGSGHETYFIYGSTPPVTADPATNELNYVFPYGTYELEKNFGVYTSNVNHNLQLFKQVSINPDGRDQISYSNAAGQTIATCITGDGTGCVSHTERKILYPQVSREVLQNMYVPAAKSGTLRFREEYGNTSYAASVTPQLYDLLNNTMLVGGTDYTYDASTGYFTFTGNYAGKSLYLQLRYSGPVTAGRFLVATAETDYTQWTLYFYDRKGRLLANTSPTNVQCQTLPSAVQRQSGTGDPGLSCNNSRVSSITFNSDVMNSSDPYAYITISPGVAPVYSLGAGASNLYLLKSDSLKYLEDSLYFINDTLAKDSLLLDARDTLLLPAAMFPNDSALKLYAMIDSLETLVPVNALRGKEIHYSGEFAIYARFAGDSIAAEPRAIIPYDYTVSGDGGTNSSGGATLRVKGNDGRIRVKVKIRTLAGEDGIALYVRNPKIELTGFGGDNPNVAGCQEPYSWLPEVYYPGLDAMGHANAPDIGIAILNWPTPVTIPLANKYMYDEYDRLVASINEDQGTVYYVYDQKEDKLLFTQNQKQRDAGGKFSCLVYDDLGRPVVSGEYDPANGGPTTGDTPFLFQDYYTWKAGTTVPAGRISTGTAAAANNSTYNDGHLFDRTFIQYDEADAGLPVNFGSNPYYYKQAYTAGKVSKTWNNHTTTWYSYDELGRQTWSVQHSTELGYKTLNYLYDLRGKLQASAYQLQNPDNLIHQYVYDADERLSTASYGVYTVANPAGYMKPLAAYSYYLHGPLKRTELGNQLQGLDYVYTIDGKLKSVNNPVNSAAGSDPGLDGYSTGPHAGVSADAFAFALEYYPGDYARGSSPIRSYNNANAYSHNLSYTGLVKAQSWRTVLPSAASSAYSTGLMYEYQYDHLYRLTGATFGSITETAPTLGNPMWTNTFTQKPEYKLENISYDANGNLQHLKRYAAPISSSTAHLLDDLSYTYNSTKKNKLETIGDAASNTAGYSAELDLPNQTNSANYVYNSIGELVENKQEDRGYEYNATGLVSRVYQLSTGSTLAEYTYNDKGLRYSKTSYSGGLFNVETEQLFYVYDAGGALVATYKKLVQLPGTVYALQAHTLYAAGRMGLLDAATGEALYELNDHVGNVRAVVKAGSSGVAETVSYTDYYPHGGVLPGRNYTSSITFPYGYQGQEKDAATGLTNFELRQYDPRIGRWYNPDPYMQHHSPYLAMSNNPVSFTDPDGGWDASYGADDAERDARWAYMGGAQNAFINGDADAYVNGLENMALVKNAYNDYRARHTNENGEWGNWMTGGSTRDLGDESHTHFDIDESAKIDNSIFRQSLWAPLDKATFKEYVRINYCLTCGNGLLEQKTGEIFENLFEQMLDRTFASEDFLVYKNPLNNKVDGGIRNTVPDFIGISLRGRGLQPSPSTFYELKATKNGIGLGSFDKQIAAQITALAKLPVVEGVRREMILVTTSDVKITKPLQRFAKAQGVTLTHYITKYMMVGSTINLKYELSGSTVYPNFKP